MILMSLNSKQEDQTLRLLTFECKIEREKKIVLVISILNRQQSHKEY